MTHLHWKLLNRDTWKCTDFHVIVGIIYHQRNGYYQNNTQS